jgi:hypothetical protein
MAYSPVLIAGEPDPGNITYAFIIRLDPDNSIDK